MQRAGENLRRYCAASRDNNGLERNDHDDDADFSLNSFYRCMPGYGCLEEVFVIERKPLWSLILRFVECVCDRHSRYPIATKPAATIESKY